VKKTTEIIIVVLLLLLVNVGCTVQYSDKSKITSDGHIEYKKMEKPLCINNILYYNIPDPRTGATRIVPAFKEVGDGSLYKCRPKATKVVDGVYYTDDNWEAVD
jgi:regulatory protein YycI of two-component signal transduction system YycFG